MILPRTERSLGELFGELSQEALTLIHQEIQLAKAEISQKMSQAGRDITFLAIGGFVTYAGFLALIAAAILGLSVLMPGWLAALIIGLIIASIGYVLVQKGLNNLREIDAKPAQTIQTLKEDKEWLSQQI